jgi:TolB protein
MKPLGPADAVPASGLSGRIAYGASDGHIWVLDVATGRLTQVTNGTSGNDFDPHWSPDGHRLVFRSTRFRFPDPDLFGLDGIVLVSVEGGVEQEISGTGGLFPNWSPDGRTIVYSSVVARTEHLVAYDPLSGERRDLAVYGEGLEWSPDGSSVVVDREQGTVDEIAGRRRGVQNWEIWRLNADFTNAVRLTDSRGDDYLGSWSPDGSVIAFATKRNDDGDIWVMAPDGTAASPVVEWPGSQSDPRFLPDGRMLFSDHSQGEPRWYLLSPTHDALERLEALDGVEGPVAWHAVVSLPR